MNDEQRSCSTATQDRKTASVTTSISAERGPRHALRTPHRPHVRIAVVVAVALVAGLVSWRLSSDQTASHAALPRTHHPTSTTAPLVTTTTGVPAGYTAADLEFEDTFGGTSLDTTKWNPYVTSNSARGVPWNTNGHGGSSLQNPVVIANQEYYLPTQAIVNNGLDLMAQETQTAGMLAGVPKTYAWRSGAVTTYGKFQFTGGYVQIVAKMPSSPGMWPSLWTLPGPGATNGDDVEIDMFEGGYYGNGVDPLQNYSWHLHTQQGLEGGVTNVGVDLSAEFHTYGMQWVPDQSIKWFLDGQLVGEVTEKQTPIPDEPMELIMNLAISNSTSAAYRTTPDESTATVDNLLIQKVQIYR
jgi:beta-glucanase (GH16 family)